MQGFGWRYLESESGFSLVEMLVASVIFSFMVVALVATYMNGRLFMLSEGARRQALILAQNRLEELKLSDFAGLESMLAAPEEMDISIADVDFVRSVDLNYVDEWDYTLDVANPTDALKLTITVSDNDMELNFADVVLQTVVANKG